MTAASVYPRSGVCSNCGRESDTLAWHEPDGTLYCVDVFRCEARLEILRSQGRPPLDRPEHLSGVSP